MFDRQTNIFDTSDGVDQVFPLWNIRNDLLAGENALLDVGVDYTRYPNGREYLSFHFKSSIDRIFNIFAVDLCKGDPAPSTEAVLMGVWSGMVPFIDYIGTIISACEADIGEVRKMRELIQKKVFELAVLKQLGIDFSAGEEASSSCPQWFGPEHIGVLLGGLSVFQYECVDGAVTQRVVILADGGLDVQWALMIDSEVNVVNILKAIAKEYLLRNGLVADGGFVTMSECLATTGCGDLTIATGSGTYLVRFRGYVPIGMSLE